MLASTKDNLNLSLSTVFIKLVSFTVMKFKEWSIDKNMECVIDQIVVTLAWVPTAKADLKIHRNPAYLTGKF